MQNIKSRKVSPRISVIIPSYNKVKFIGKTLESIFSQSYKNVEVVIQDGGSSDGTVEIIKSYVKKYPGKIIFESKKDKGQLDAVNKGLKKATGEILTFINADDCYEDGTFNSISRMYLLNPNALWFAGQGTVVNENDAEIAKIVSLYKNLCLFINRKSLILILNYLIQPSVFFTKKAYQRYGPFTGTPNFIMEYEFWLKLGKIKMPVSINKNISKFRIESSTKTKRLFKSLLLEDEKIVKKYTKNRFILFLHKLNNIGRLVVQRFV